MSVGADLDEVDFRPGQPAEKAVRDSALGQDHVGILIVEPLGLGHGLLSLRPHSARPLERLIAPARLRIAGKLARVILVSDEAVVVGDGFILLFDVQAFDLADQRLEAERPQARLELTPVLPYAAARADVGQYGSRANAPLRTSIAVTGGPARWFAACSLQG